MGEPEALTPARHQRSLLGGRGGRASIGVWCRASLSPATRKPSRRTESQPRRPPPREARPEQGRTTDVSSLDPRGPDRCSTPPRASPRRCCRPFLRLGQIVRLIHSTALANATREGVARRAILSLPSRQGCDAPQTWRAATGCPLRRHCTATGTRAQERSAAGPSLRDAFAHQGATPFRSR